MDWRPEGAKRQRRYFPSEAAACSHATSLRLQVHKGDEQWFTFTEADRCELITVWNEVRKAGQTVRGVWEAFRAKPNSSTAPTIETVISELTTAKTNAGRTKRTVDSLKSVVNQFARANPGKAIDTIGLADLERFLDARPITGRASTRSKLSTLLKFAVRRRYRPDNPCERLEAVKVVRPPPAIFTVAQAKFALTWFRKEWPRALPWFVLTTFCGLRPEEAQQVTKADIHFAEGWIRVEALTTKVRQRRIVYPKREAMALIKRSLRVGRLPLDPQSRRRAIRKLRGAMGFAVWPKDITRHTAASYWLADTSSAADMAEQLGNSETVLKRHYKAIVTREQAKEFWRLCGKTIRA